MLRYIASSNFAPAIPLLCFVLLQVANDCWMQTMFSGYEKTRGILLSEGVFEVKKAVQETKVAENSPASIPLEKYAPEISSITAWSTSMLMLILLLVVAISSAFLCSLESYKEAKRSTKKSILIGLIVTLIAVVVLEFYVIDGYRMPPTKPIMESIESYFSKSCSFNVYSPIYWLVGREADTITLNYPYYGTVKLANILILVSALLLGIALGFLIGLPSAKETPEVLLQRIVWAKRLLFIYSTMIIAGIFEMRLLYQLPTMWLETDGDEQITSMSSAIVSSAGVKHSAMLLLMVGTTSYY